MEKPVYLITISTVKAQYHHLLSVLTKLACALSNQHLIIMEATSTSSNTIVNCRWSLPGIWAYAAFITANNYLQAQRIVRPQVVTSAVVLAIHPPLNWLCIYTLGKLHLSLHMLDVCQA